MVRKQAALARCEDGKEEKDEREVKEPELTGLGMGEGSGTAAGLAWMNSVGRDYSLPLLSGRVWDGRVFHVSPWVSIFRIHFLDLKAHGFES